jgi:hypothetical protein
MNYTRSFRVSHGGLPVPLLIPGALACTISGAGQYSTSERKINTDMKKLKATEIPENQSKLWARS